MKPQTLWQSRSVEISDPYVALLPVLGAGAPMQVESLPYPKGYKVFTALGVQETIETPSVVVTFALPSDPQGYTLSGEVRLMVSTSEYRRDSSLDTARIPLPDVQLSINPNNERDELIYKLVLPSPSGIFVYVTLMFYEETTRKWLTSAEFLMGHTLTRDLMGSYGAFLFNLMPRYQRAQDDKNNGSLERLLKLFGSSLDDTKALLTQLERSYEVSSVDTAYLPYIDRLLGWSTNFELNELNRRYETEQAVSLWKAKGSARALELVMQNTIGWNVTIHEGHKRTINTNDYPLALPTDWVEGEVDPDSTLPVDQQPTGVWEADVSMTTWSPEQGQYSLSPDSKVMVLPSRDSWHSENGVLIEVKPASGARQVLTSVALKKASNVIRHFVPHYVDVYFYAKLYSQESFALSFNDLWDEDLAESGNDTEAVRLDMTDDFTSIAVGVYPFSTWDKSSELNNVTYRLFHMGLNYES